MKLHVDTVIYRFASECWSGSETIKEQMEANPLLGNEPEHVYPLLTVESGGVGQRSDEAPAGIYFIPALANVGIIVTSKPSLILVDVCTPNNGDSLATLLQSRFPPDRYPLEAVVYTHGHADHVGGMRALLEKYGYSQETKSSLKKQKVLRTYAHERCLQRFKRYSNTTGYNSKINSRQFQVESEFLEPMYTYATSPETGEDAGGFLVPPNCIVSSSSGQARLLMLQDPVSGGGVGNVELRHNLGETDDALWVWVPECKTILIGDFFIWNHPNCGNPQKVQRYPLEWARALDEMASLQPQLMVPGHGPPIVGGSNVQDALRSTARFLHLLVSSTLDVLNQNTPLNKALYELLPTWCSCDRAKMVKRSADEVLKQSDNGDFTLSNLEKELIPLFISKPFLRPFYDDPSFIIQNLYRLYGGWYGGWIPSLRPAKNEAVGLAILRFAELSRKLGNEERALETLVSDLLAAPDKDSQINTALGFVEYLYVALRQQSSSTMSTSVSREKIAEMRKEVLVRMLSRETCLMGKGVYKNAIQETEAEVTNNRSSKL